MSSDEEDEDESDIRKVMPGEANAALLAAQNAAANALQAAVRTLIWPCTLSPCIGGIQNIPVMI